MLRFIVGLVAGVAIGAAAASASQASGRDLRAEFELIRRDLEKRDFEALGTHLEERFKELQSYLETRWAEASAEAEEAMGGAEEAMGETEEAAAEAAEEVEEAFGAEAAEFAEAVEEAEGETRP